MKRRINAIILAGLALVLGCSKPSVKQTQSGYGFEVKRIYSIAIMPLSASRVLTMDRAQQDSVYSFLVSNLIVTGRFDVVDREPVEQAVAQSGVQEPVDRDMARSIGKQVGADVVGLLDLSLLKSNPPSVSAVVDIFPVAGGSPSFHGSGQGDGEAPLLTGIRQALDQATEKIVPK